jgi:hypothetical protein
MSKASTIRRTAGALTVVVVGAALLMGINAGGGAGASAGAATTVGWTVAYVDAASGDLSFYDVTSATSTDSGHLVAPLSSPSMANDGAGGLEVAYVAADGNLAYVDTRSNNFTETTLAVAAGTSPSIAVGPSGGVRIAYQGSSGTAHIFSPASGHDTDESLAMAAGSNPAITALRSGGWELGVRAPDDALMIFDTATSGVTRTTATLEAGSSPAVVPRGTGALFTGSSSTSTLLTYATSSATLAQTNVGLAAGTSPAAAATAAGIEIVATGKDGALIARSPSQLTTDTGEALAPGSSPALAAASGGGWQAAFVGSDGHLMVYGSRTTVSVAAHSEPTIATTASVVLPSSTTALYEQVPASAEDCYATSGDPLVPLTSCTPWASAPTIVAPGTLSPLGDGCEDYGTNARLFSSINGANLAGVVGFTSTSTSFQRMDPISGSTCATSGSAPRYGMLLTGSGPSSFCVIGTCGLQHTVDFRGNALRPWFANGQFEMAATFDPVSDNAGAAPGAYPASDWHAYMCPWVRDVSTGQRVEFCQETWRSDAGSPPFCTSIQTAGTNICTSGGEVSAICELDASGLNECIYPNYGTPEGPILWSRPEPGTKLTTSTGASYEGLNTFGAHRYDVTVTQANLSEIIRLLNLALSIDHWTGHDLSTKAYSSSPSDYAVIGLEAGAEGLTVYGGTSATLGLSVAGLTALSHQ